MDTRCAGKLIWAARPSAWPAQPHPPPSSAASPQETWNHTARLEKHRRPSSRSTTGLSEGPFFRLLEDRAGRINKGDGAPPPTWETGRVRGAGGSLALEELVQVPHGLDAPEDALGAVAAVAGGPAGGAGAVVLGGRVGSDGEQQALRIPHAPVHIPGLFRDSSQPCT